MPTRRRHDTSYTNNITDGNMLLVLISIDIESLHYRRKIFNTRSCMCMCPVCVHGNLNCTRAYILQRILTKHINKL